MPPFWATCCASMPCRWSSHTLSAQVLSQLTQAERNSLQQMLVMLKAERSTEAVKASLLIPIATHGPAIKLEHREAHRHTVKHLNAMPSSSLSAACHLQVERKTTQGILALIEADRSGEAVDASLLAHLLRMYTHLGIYAEAFQGPLLEQTRSFYALEGVQVMQDLDTPEYLLHCEVRWGMAVCVSNRCLNAST